LKECITNDDDDEIAHMKGPSDASDEILKIDDPLGMENTGTSQRKASVKI